MATPQRRERLSIAATDGTILSTDAAVTASTGSSTNVRFTDPCTCTRGVRQNVNKSNASSTWKSTKKTTNAKRKKERHGGKVMVDPKRVMSTVR